LAARLRAAVVSCALSRVRSRCSKDLGRGGDGAPGGFAQRAARSGHGAIDLQAQLFGEDGLLHPKINGVLIFADGFGDGGDRDACREQFAGFLAGDEVGGGWALAWRELLKGRG